MTQAKISGFVKRMKNVDYIISLSVYSDFMEMLAQKSIYINGIVGVSVCLYALNLRGLKSHDHETWHVGPLSDLDVHGPSGILIFGRVAPQAHAA